MTATMRNASIVLLFGLALTNAAKKNEYDPVPEATEKRFIITPTKMDDKQKKLSKVEQARKFQVKVEERKTTLIANMKARDKVQKDRDDLNAKIKFDFKPQLDEAEATIEGLTTAIEELTKTTIPAAKQKVQEADADAKEAEKTALADLEKDLKQRESAKANWAKVLEKVKNKKTEQDKKNKPTEGAKEDDSEWGKKLATLETDLKNANAKVEEYAEDNEAAWPDKSKTPSVGGKTYPDKDDGGVGYWRKKIRNLKVPASGTWVAWQSAGPPQTIDGETKFDMKRFDDLTFEGFFDTPDSQKFIVTAKKTLDDMKALFKYKLPKYMDDEPVEVDIATVEEAKDKDTACLTPNTLLKVSEDLYDLAVYDPAEPETLRNLKDHAATITGFSINVEMIMMEDRKLMVKGDDDKWNVVDEKDNHPEGKKGADDQVLKVDKLDKYPMYFINHEGIRLSVYTKAAKQRMALTIQRDGTYDVVADQRTMSVAPVKADGTTPDSASATKAEEPSKAWMVVAIIALVILFLGGAVIAYRAYTASGSSQNTDL